MKKLRNKRQGSLTVEASLIFPIVFFAIVSLLYISIYLHDTTALKAITNEATERFQLAYANKVDIETGHVLTPRERLSKGLYWRWTKQRGYEAGVKAFIMKEAEARLFLKDGQLDIETGIENYIIKQNLIIEVKKNFRTPLDPVNKLLGIGNGGKDMVIYTQTSMKDPAEVIRNMDYLDDLSDYLGPVKTAKEKYREKINDIIGFFENL